MAAEKTIGTGIRLTKKLRDKVKAEAKKQGQSFNSRVVYLLEQAHKK